MRLSDQQKIDLVEKYRAGTSMWHLAREYDIAIGSVRSILRRRGVEIRSWPPRAEPQNPLEKLFDALHTSWSSGRIVRIRPEIMKDRGAKALAKLLVKLGVKDLSEIRGLTLKRIRERAQKGQAAVTKPVPAVVDRKLCNGCTLCERVCVYGAARMKGKTRETRKASIDVQTCVGCGLCVSVCPTEAIRQVYYE